MDSNKDLNKFGLNQRENDDILSILKKYSEIKLVHIFGSRAKGNYKVGSDVDLVIMNHISDETLRKIKTDFEESSLPLKVDLVVFSQLTNPEFTEHILRAGLEFYKLS